MFPCTLKRKAYPARFYTSSQRVFADNKPDLEVSSRIGTTLRDSAPCSRIFYRRLQGKYIEGAPRGLRPSLLRVSQDLENPGAIPNIRHGIYSANESRGIWAMGPAISPRRGGKAPRGGNERLGRARENQLRISCARRTTLKQSGMFLSLHFPSFTSSNMAEISGRTVADVANPKTKSDSIKASCDPKAKTRRRNLAGLKLRIRPGLSSFNL